MALSHPLLLVGVNLYTWKFDIPDAFENIFNSSTIPLVKDIIKLNAGKYIISFNSTNTMLISLFHNLYYDTARIVISKYIYYEISIADVTKQRYVLSSEFKTTSPYKCVNPFILYKKDIPRAFACELNEVKTEIYSVL